MKTKLDLVKDFRLTMGLPVNDEPTELSRESRELHARNIIEEAGEILEAINPDGTINKLKARDVSGDLLYFALGLVAEAGLDWDEEECVLRVCKEVSPDLIHDAELRYIFGDIVEVAGQLGSPDMVQETAHMLCQYAIQIDAVIGELSWLDDDFLKIHEANMAKLWTGKQVEAKFGSRIDWPGLIKNRRCVGSADGLWEASNLSGVTNAWVVRLNGKVQKPPGWKAAVLEGGAVESRPGKLITPPYVHKLIKQISEAIQEEQLELFDPSFDKSYTFDISISIQEARALIEFNTLLNGPLDGFIKYDEEGRPIV